MRKTATNSTTKTKKLQLSAQTIRELEDKQMLAVVGGVRKAGTGTCPE